MENITGAQRGRVCLCGTLPVTMAAPDRPVAMRHSHETGLCLYDLDVPVPGPEALNTQAEPLADPRLAYANIHTAPAGRRWTRVQPTPSIA